MEAPVNREWNLRIAASSARLRELAGRPDETPPALFVMPDARPVGDEGDIAQVVIDGEIAQRVADLKASLQAQLGRALDRLELGRYGYCEDCSEEISIERMEFAPETTTCVRCQGRRDRTG